MEPVIVTMIGLSAATGFMSGWALARFIRIRWGIALVVALLLMAVALTLIGEGMLALDGLAYVVVALFIALPAALAAALGTALAGWMQRRLRNK